NLMLFKPRHRLALRHRLSQVKLTPLTVLIWALLISDLAAPGYLKFHVVTTQFDAAAFIRDALAE
ncbi:MAG: hypothetical protein AAFP03_19325, partial [Cyanobacteria bacterium J06598_3]